MIKRCDGKTNKHPRDAANPLSIVTFFYTLGIFRKGFQKELEEQDLYENYSSLNSQKLGDLLENKWESDKKKNKKPSLIRALWMCFGKKYIFYGLIEFCMKTIMVLTIPTAMGKLVSYFSPKQKSLSKNDAYFYASVVIGLNLVNLLYKPNFDLKIKEIGIQVRAAICSLIYRKSLKVSGSTDSTLGKLVTIITKDVFAIEVIVHVFHTIWIDLVQISIIFYLIFTKLGISTFTAIGIFVGIMPLQFVMAKFGSSFRTETLKRTDDRIEATQEALSIIKIIKMWVWEDYFEKKILASRKKEINYIHRVFYLKIAMIISSNLFIKIAFYLLIMTYIWTGNILNAEIVYFVVTCFDKLRHLLGFGVPFGISQFADLHASLHRIEALLNGAEVSPIKPILQLVEPKIIMKNISINNILQKVSLNLQKGLNIIEGSVGCGKTTFLRSILGDVKTDGEVIVNGRISYASQEPWLFPSSIKDNILFGQKMNEKRYDFILKICALTYDLELLPDGDNTIVSDQGLNLSKGQQARVNLARAIYQDSDIYLLDDCLSSLDPTVANHIFKTCIKNFLKDKLIIYVTNNVDQIKKADTILKINERFMQIVKNEYEKDDDDSSLELEDVKFKQALNEDFVGNVYCEKQKEGKVPIQIYYSYFKFGGGVLVALIILLFFGFAQFTQSYTDKMVSKWTTIEQNLSDYKEKEFGDNTTYNDLLDHRSQILTLYSIMVLVSIGISVVRTVMFFVFVKKISINMHKLLIQKVLHAAMTFFDRNLIGNIINRFSKDISIIDEQIPFVIHGCIHIFFIIPGSLILIGTVLPIFLIPAGFLFLTAYGIKYVYQPAGRSLQRLTTATRSPMVGHLKATIDGLTTIRALKGEQMFLKQFEKHQDLYISTEYTLDCCSKALSFMLETMSSIFITVIIGTFLFFETGVTVGNAGLAISQAFGITGILQHVTRTWAELENIMTSVERILEYTEVPQEDTKGKAVDNWPKDGKIEYNKVSLSYRSNQMTLKELQFAIEPRQKIGIIGRTGAGKSSIISTLFRLYEVDGQILIDGTNTRDISLGILRSNISVIPQDPILFSGSIRENMDPLNLYNDEKIWKVIETVKLKSLVQDLDAQMTNHNLSAGQKQLFSLGRALLKNNRIVIFDEATANLDEKTEDVIKEIIKENFKTYTKLFIAHRLESIADSDKVMILDAGTINEFDDPKLLLTNEDSLYYKMYNKK